MTTREETPVFADFSSEHDVVRAIEGDIIFGRLTPGTRLVEEALMARFGVTRHFIRQALARLERSGVVVHERNIGATVRSYTLEEVRQIYEVREFLQRQAVLMIRLPAEETLIAQLERLNAAYRDEAERADARGMHEANDAFHLALFGACGNPYLVRSIRDYMVLSLPMRAQTLINPDALKISLQQHGIMIELLRGQDSWALAQLCVDHLQPSKQDYVGRIGSK